MSLYCSCLIHDLSLRTNFSVNDGNLLVFFIHRRESEYNTFVRMFSPSQLYAKVFIT
jgi:hypothetical protein